MAKSTRNRICFIHVTRDGYTPDIKLLPLGLIAIADYLVKNGFDSTIIHLGLEKRLDPSFNLRRFIKENRYLAVLFDLHWHYQAYCVIKTIKDVKRYVRDVKVIVGGFTASFFSDEIMERFGEIDFVVRGDSEVPLMELLRSLRDRKADFLTIPNLSWRKGAGVIHNCQDYVIDKKMMAGLCFTHFELIRNYEKYIEMFSTGLGEHDKTPVFYYTPGRGCGVNCSFCGGSRISHRIINNRREVALTDTKSAAEDLSKISRYNISKVNVCFDPFPDSTYYIRLFRALSKKNIKLCMDFECFRLPSKKFIDQFARSFNAQSSITISPESGSEKVRIRNKGMYYSNAELFGALAYLHKKKIKAYVSFTAGLPFENRQDIIKTLNLIGLIRSRFKDIEINAEAIAFEPASPWYLYRKKYGIVSNMNTFLDFYKAHKSGSSVGYRTEFFSGDEIQAIIELYRAQSRCIYKESSFLRLLTDSKFKAGDFDFQRIHRACKECGNYPVCFRPKLEK